MHHAYLFEGSLSITPLLHISAVEHFGFKNPKEGAHPDVHVYTYEKFNIEEARALAEEASIKSISGRALFIIGATSITTDAQQALLKLFEEPQAGTIFILLVPHGTLIPTLASRFADYPLEVVQDERQGKSATAFLKSSNKERSAQIVALLKDDEHMKERVRDLLNAIEQRLYAAELKSPDPVLRQALTEIGLVRKYIGDRSASLKMLLEHLALALPTL
jgi:DNA polymerase III delta prime subunit